MCRVAARALVPGPSAAAEARAFTRSRLTRWELAELELDAVLLVSELVTNAVLHGGTGVSLSVAVADGVLEVGVTDTSTVPLPRQGPDHLPRSPMPDAWSAEGGRGLHLLDAVAVTWGVTTVANGKQVWFRLAVPDPWPHRPDCPCAGTELSDARLTSGTRVLAVSGSWDDE